MACPTDAKPCVVQKRFQGGVRSAARLVSSSVLAEDIRDLSDAGPCSSLRLDGLGMALPAAWTRAEWHILTFIAIIATFLSGASNGDDEYLAAGTDEGVR